MCRSKTERAGGKRCIGKGDHQAIVKRNARRRELYALKKAKTSSNPPALELKTPKFVIEKDFGEISAPPKPKPVAPTSSEKPAERAYTSEVDFADLNEVRAEMGSREQILNQSEHELVNLSEEQRVSIQYFTGMNYYWINAALFGKKVLKTGTAEDSDERNARDLIKVVDQLDSAFMVSPLTERIVYRGKSGFSPRFEGSASKLQKYVDENYSEGSEVVFDGYQSASLSPQVAAGFGSDGIVFEMKNRSGLSISSESEFEHEAEVLIPRSTRWKIVKVTKNVIYRTNGEEGPTDTPRITVVQMVEVDDSGNELTERKAPPALTKLQTYEAQA